MKVLIAGAGIGGLTTALSLEAIGVRDIRIVEAAAEIKELGVGINILPHSVRELSELGLEKQLRAGGIEAKPITYYNQHGDLIGTFARGGTEYGWPAYHFHRGRLQMILYRKVQEVLGEDSVRTGVQLASFDEREGSVRAALIHRDRAETTLEEADLLIGADGAASVTRSILYPDEGPPVWNGNVMTRAVTRGLAGDILKRPMIYAGHYKRRFLSYPILDPDDNVVLNWGGTYYVGGQQPGPRDWNKRVNAADVAAVYDGWNLGGLDVPDVMRRADAVFEYPQVDRDPVPRWSFGCVTLLGDAAHPMHPAGSQGASQAILDARALARHLDASDSIPEALRRYDDERIEPTARIVLENRRMGDGRVLQLVHERAPDGFDSIEDVMSQEELEQITGRYRQLSGFDPQTLKARVEADLP